MSMRNIVIRTRDGDYFHMDWCQAGSGGGHEGMVKCVVCVRCAHIQTK